MLRNAINAWTRASHPQTVDVLRRLLFALATALYRFEFISLRQQALDFGAQRAAKEVDVLKLLKPAT